MSNWKLINKTYIYDGTFEGLLTIVFDSYLNKTLPQKIIASDSYINNFLDNTTSIKTDYEKSQKVFDSIVNNICKDALYNSYYAFLAKDGDKEMNILKSLNLEVIKNNVTLETIYEDVNDWYPIYFYLKGKDYHSLSTLEQKSFMQFLKLVEKMVMLVDKELKI